MTHLATGNRNLTAPQTSNQPTDQTEKLAQLLTGIDTSAIRLVIGVRRFRKGVMDVPRRKRADRDSKQPKLNCPSQHDYEPEKRKRYNRFNR